MQHDVVQRQGRRIAAIICGLWLAVGPGAMAQSNTPPSATIQPADGIVGATEDFAFTAVTTGTPPFTYQWSLHGSVLAGETNSVLLLTNLTGSQAGFYSVTISNLAGSTMVSNANLTVLFTNLVRRLQTGRVVQSGSQVAVPILLRANSRESSVSFSLSYDTNYYGNPVFLPTVTNATVMVNASQPGTIGVAETLPSGQTFPPGFPWLGVVQFNLATNNGALLGGLEFTTNPIPLAAANSNGMSLAISASVEPQFVLGTAAPSLDLQSGLYLQKLLVSNPSGSIWSNINVLALRLGNDSRTNPITLYNLSGSLASFPQEDPIMAVGDTCCGYSLDAGSACGIPGYLACGGGGSSIDFTGDTNVSLPFGQISAVLPGQTVVFTSEFYVSDHRTVPQPSYALSSSGPVFRAPPTVATTPLAITRYLYDTNSLRFILQFPTRLGLHYYVQYSDNPANLGTTNAQTAIPAVIGTGSAVQWIDDGPPKTLSPPASGSRYYSVLQGQ